MWPAGLGMLLKIVCMIRGINPGSFWVPVIVYVLPDENITSCDLLLGWQRRFRDAPALVAPYANKSPFCPLKKDSTCENQLVAEKRKRLISGEPAGLRLSQRLAAAKR
jgi:hypothetical protein